MLSKNEQNEFLKGFVEIEIVGKGGFGTCSLMLHKDSGKIVIMK